MVNMEIDMDIPKGPKCPKCNKNHSVVPVVFANEGTIKLGGYFTTGSDDRSYCKDCSFRFGPMSERPETEDIFDNDDDDETNQKLCFFNFDE